MQVWRIEIKIVKKMSVARSKNFIFRQFIWICQTLYKINVVKRSLIPHARPCRPYVNPFGLCLKVAPLLNVELEVKVKPPYHKGLRGQNLHEIAATQGHRLFQPCSRLKECVICGRKLTCSVISSFVTALSSDTEVQDILLVWAHASSHFGIFLGRVKPTVRVSCLL